MAQQVEHVLGKDEVTGSNPVSSSIQGDTKVLVSPFFRAANRVAEIWTRLAQAQQSLFRRCAPYTSG